MKKQFLSVVSIVLFGAAIASAQPQPQPVKQINKGVLNGAAVSLAKPAYPAAARAVNAEGAVNVQVTIDENGEILSATAVSGHPLLRAAAAQAARESKFSPTTLSGQAVKVTGIIVYNFVGEDRAANWLKIGYDLGSAQYSSNTFLNANRIGKSFGADWATEKEQLQKLTETNRAAVMSNMPPPPPPPPLPETKAGESAGDKTDAPVVRKMMVVRKVGAANVPASGEQIALAQSLISSLQGRLAGSEVELWQLNTGAALSQLLAKGKNQSDKQSALATFRQQIQFAPGSVSPESLAEMQRLAAILEKTDSTPEDAAQIGQILSILFAK